MYWSFKICLSYNSICVCLSNASLFVKSSKLKNRSPLSTSGITSLVSSSNDFYRSFGERSMKSASKSILLLKALILGFSGFPHFSLSSSLEVKLSIVSCLTTGFVFYIPCGSITITLLSWLIVWSSSIVSSKQMNFWLDSIDIASNNVFEFRSIKQLIN